MYIGQRLKVVFIKPHVILLLGASQIIDVLRAPEAPYGRQLWSKASIAVTSFISRFLVMTWRCVRLRVGGPLDDSLVDRE